MYELHNLGWHSFQQLCVTITREILGQTVESFLESADAGKDGAFEGTWKPVNGESLEGRFVIQCKFTSKHDKNLAVSDLAEDAEKASKLVQNNRCDCYVLMTNAGLSGSAKEDIETLLKNAGVKHFRAYGSTWICDQIRENKRLRMLVPRLYGLGDLSQILDERAYSQAKALLTSLKEDLSKVVLTAAYRKSAEALDKHGFVLLIGEPAAGKTTIASMLSLGALDQWSASTLKLESPEQVVEHWNPDEPSQFFWIDDAFGVTQYESSLVYGWNHRLAMVKTMLRNGAKIVMTSRDYIYNRARKDLKESAFPLLRESQVVIDVKDLSPEEKQQILYNHIKLGRQEQWFRGAVKPYLQFVAEHNRFIPETARRLADPLFTEGLQLNRYSLEEFVERQERFLQEVLLGLDDHSKAALALIYMRNGSMESPVVLQQSEREAIERMNSSVGGCVAALESLKGSLVQHKHAQSTAIWTFKHPTVGDAFASLLLQNPELLHVYVQGTPIDKLVRQVTCGDVGLERAVILPKSLFETILNKLDERSAPPYKSLALAQWYVQGSLDRFLSFRCSKEFVQLYINRHPEILKRVSTPGLFLNTVSEVDLAINLHRQELLPEKNRKAFVDAVVNYAIAGEDLEAIQNTEIQSVFTEEELSEFQHRVKAELIPNLRNVRHRWQRNRPSDESADDYLGPFIESLRAVTEKYADDFDLTNIVETEIELAEQWIAEELHSPQESRPPRTFGDVETPMDAAVFTRNIFDDVDE